MVLGVQYQIMVFVPKVSLLHGSSLKVKVVILIVPKLDFYVTSLGTISVTCLNLRDYERCKFKFQRL